MAARRGWSCGLRWLARQPGDAAQTMAVILWMDGELVVGADLYEEADDPLADLAESFVRATSRPMVGEPRRPVALRADSNDLAKRLAPAIGLAVEVVETPEIDEAFAALSTHLESQLGSALVEPPDPVEVLGPVAGLAAIETTAALLAHPPWRCLPPDLAVGVGISELGIRGGRISVMGHNAECYGFLLFTAARDFEAFAEIAEAGGTEDRDLLPDYLCFEIEPVEIDPDEPPCAVPVLRAFGPDGFRDADAEEIEVLLAAAGALARLVERRGGSRALAEALDGGRQVSSRYRIDLFDDSVAVRLWLPAE